MGAPIAVQGVPDYNYLKIIKMATAVIPGLGSPGSNTTASPQLKVIVNHGLGFNPTFFTFALAPKIDWWGTQLNNIIVQMPIGYNEVSGATQNYYDLIAYADNQNLYIYNNWSTHSSPTPIPAITVTYILFSSFAVAT